MYFTEQQSMLAAQESGLGSSMDGWGGGFTTVSDMLSLYGQFEATKQNGRFLELQNQNAALDNAMKSQNIKSMGTDAKADSVSAWIEKNPALAVGVGLAAVVLLMMALK